MQLLSTTLLIILFTPLVTCATSDRFTPCLPDGINLKSEVLEQTDGLSKRKPKTVQSKLIELRAQCKHGKLITRSGKEIRIVQLIGCWGNPPEDYQEQLDRQQLELKQLRAKYIVIEIPCSTNKTIASVRYASACRDVTKNLRRRKEDAGKTNK